MRLWNLLAGSVVAVSMVAGCSYQDQSKVVEPVKKAEAATKPTTAKADAPKVDDKAAKEAAAVAKAEYFEAVDKKFPERVYVMASKQTADDVAAGKHPALTRTKIGFGPKGETVVFEDSDGGGVARKLIESYKTKHNIN